MKTDKTVVCHKVADEHSRLVNRISALNLYSAPLDCDNDGGVPTYPVVFAEHLPLLRDRWDETYRHICSLVAPWLDSFETSDGDYSFTFKDGCQPQSADSLIREYAQASMTFGLLGSPRGDVYRQCMEKASTALRNELCAAEMRR